MAMWLLLSEHSSKYRNPGYDSSYYVCDWALPVNTVVGPGGHCPGAGSAATSRLSQNLSGSGLEQLFGLSLPGQELTGSSYLSGFTGIRHTYKLPVFLPGVSLVSESRL
eukprot:852086-Rhodomonas_salina.2